MKCQLMLSRQNDLITISALFFCEKFLERVPQKDDKTYTDKSYTDAIYFIYFYLSLNLEGEVIYP